MLALFNFSILSLLVVTVKSATLLAERVQPALSRRQQDTFTGGWSTRQTTCPAGTFECPKYEGMPACCPEGTECEQSYMTGYNYVACCPKGQSCQKLIQSLPVCAKPDWVLYTHKRLYKSPFCCLPGQKAYITTQSGKHPACGPENLAVESTNVASTVRPATALEEPVKSGNAAVATGRTNVSVKPTITSYITPGPGSSGASLEGESSADGSTTGGDSGSKSSVPIGGIVGGVVGGVAVLGLLALGFFYVARAGRKKDATNGVDQPPTSFESGPQVPSPSLANKVPEPWYTEQAPVPSWTGPTPPQQQSPYTPPPAPSYQPPGHELDSTGVPYQHAGQYQEMDGSTGR